MTSDRLVVFVDALPIEDIGALEMASGFLQWARPIRPGFGYSINVKSELFAGLRPDDVGFLNEWTYAPGQGYSWARSLKWLTILINRSRIFRRGLYKGISLIAGENLRNIPFQMLPSLVRTGITAYEYEYEHPSVLTEFEVSRYLYSRHNGDRPAFESLCEDLRNGVDPGAFFLATAELDHKEHLYGKGSPEYIQELGRVDLMLDTLWRLLKGRGNSPELLVISDHGMANVVKEVVFDIARHIDGLGTKYGYFVDATMARIWVSDPDTREAIDDWLRNSGFSSRVMSDEQRADWGVSSEGFCDILILLDEGELFVPNFFGDKACASMHGYLPSLESQLGVITSTRMMDYESTNVPLDATSAHKYLQKFYGA
jgi:hypothetical protein